MDGGGFDIDFRCFQNDNHLRIKAPNSEEQTEYLKEMCDWWDTTGFYIDSNESLQTTTSIHTTLSDSTSTSGADHESTTSGSQRIYSMNLLILFSILLISFFMFI